LALLRAVGRTVSFEAAVEHPAVARLRAGGADAAAEHDVVTVGAPRENQNHRANPDRPCSCRHDRYPTLWLTRPVCGDPGGYLPGKRTAGGARGRGVTTIRTPASSWC